MEYAPVPESKANLSIPVSIIEELPMGATYSEKSGQASVKVVVKNDTIYIDAVCDSLFRQVERYEMELSRVYSEKETEFEIKEKNTVFPVLKWLLIGVFLGSIITLIFTIIKQK